MHTFLSYTLYSSSGLINTIQEFGSLLYSPKKMKFLYRHVFRRSNSNGIWMRKFLYLSTLTMMILLNSSLPTVSCLTLTPSTTPEQIIESQLTALQKGDMPGVFYFASPANKERVGGDVEQFSSMVRSGPYRYLIHHTKADVLMYSQMVQSKQYLVRVIPSGYPNNSIQEYWWSLSRVRTGPTAGCYMVDAVIPNA